MRQPIEYLKGVGPARAALLTAELGIVNFGDLLRLFPYRHIDRTRLHRIADLGPSDEFAQLEGRLSRLSLAGSGRARRLTALFTDATGSLELNWFQGIAWIHKNLQEGREYRLFGRLSFFNGQPQVNHPELEAVVPGRPARGLALEPLYPGTEKLKARGLGAKQIARLIWQLLSMVTENDVPEFIPDAVVAGQKLMPRLDAFRSIHFPENADKYRAALHRLKFEELFTAQLRLQQVKLKRHRDARGYRFGRVGDLFNGFYSDHLPFELTGAQKRVIREIRQDTGSGGQMNRLLQGDVGSGKTMVALLAMLLAADNGFQSCLLAPTEILARQHFMHLTALLEGLPVRVALLTGSVKAKERRPLLESLADGSLAILVGTHAVLEESVRFHALALAVIDEQHRFGVEQRSQLWKKSTIPPHILVMTATPIPRTLAMSAYGDLDYSVIDELPPGRKPIVTVHRTERDRPAVMDFIKAEIRKGRQAYVIFPLIEESEKLDYENLMKGYENVKAYFPEPPYYISMVHGRQQAALKQNNMDRFVKNDTQIMVATTVIEVGVNVPNASVMVIENAEKFGLSQLHQLRGRVGRGSEKSFCILLTNSRLGREAQERIKIMTETNDGFRIAEKDMELRGPGDIAGTRQSGMLDFQLADLIRDRPLVDAAVASARQILESDPELNAPENNRLKDFLIRQYGKTEWSRIS